jgi:hypothetical protein
MRDHGLLYEPLVFAFPAFDEVAVEDALGDTWEGKGGECATHVTTGIADLESSDEDGVEGRPRHDSELSVGGDGVGESPVRYGGAHAALDDGGQ